MGHEYRNHKDAIRYALLWKDVDIFMEDEIPNGLGDGC